MTKVPDSAAAIDLGSNSFRLMIGIHADDKLVCLTQTRKTIRLAQGLNSTGLLTADKINTALEAITSFRREIDQFASHRVRCCGTEALRRADNRSALIKPAEQILGFPIEILTGREEAALSSRGVREAIANQLTFPSLIADVGGGSCELIYHPSVHSPAMVISLPFGAVMLAELDAIDQALALRSLSDQIRAFLPRTAPAGLGTVVGTGGTASSLAALAQRLPAYNAAMINGFSLSRAKIAEIKSSLSLLTLAQRKVLPGMDAGREEIIISGLEIYQEILATIGATGMIVSDAGLLEGILISTLNSTHT